MNDEQFILRKDHLTGFLRRLMKEHRLVAPVRTGQGDTLLSVVDDIDQARLDLAGQPVESAKPWLFPQQETLFHYRINGKKGYQFEPVTPAQTPTVYFGLRSCDLSAILYMDVIFNGNREYYYKHRRDQAVLISIGCNEPQPNCFCHATKTGPFLDFGFDLQFTDLGDRYFVEAGRTKGEALIKEFRHFFTKAAEEDVKAQYQTTLEARGSFQRQVEVQMAIHILEEQPVPESVWTELSGRCQDCGGCAYLCPTCTCFTIRDQPIDAKHGERLRCWDACTFSGFTQMAGGQNPVDKNRHAIRKRFLHKLRHDVEKHGRPSCMGCGRCVGVCFGGTDIVRFIDMVCEPKNN